MLAAATVVAAVGQLVVPAVLAAAVVTAPPSPTPHLRAQGVSSMFSTHLESQRPPTSPASFGPKRECVRCRPHRGHT
jgi:hypothetical protein